MTVSAPHEDGAIGAKGHAVEIAGGNRDDIGQIAYPVWSFDLDRSDAVGRGAVAQLSEGIIATSPDRAIGAKQKRMGTGGTGRDGHDAAADFHGNRCIFLDAGAVDA